MDERQLFVKARRFDDPSMRARQLVRPFLEGCRGNSGSAVEFWEYLRDQQKFFCADRSGRPDASPQAEKVGATFARSVLGRATGEGVCRRIRVLNEDRWTL